MKCDNCSRDAVYMIKRSNANTIYLCNYDLPASKRADAMAGKFAFPEEPVSKKKKAAVVEPEVVEQPAAEVPSEPVDEGN